MRKSVKIADQLAERLTEEGLSVLYDDRDERPGVKFKDADLIGSPLRIAVGEKSLAKGVVEIKLRRESDLRPTEIAQAADVAIGLLSELLSETTPA